MESNEEKPSNPRMHNPDGVYASEARTEDYFDLRDYFAAKALTGLISCSPVIDGLNFNMGNKTHVAVFAKNSYQMADAMLKQREL